MTLEKQIETEEIKIPMHANILVLCMAGSVRSPLLKQILEQNGYKCVDYGGIGAGPVKRRATIGMLEWADVIVATAPDVAENLAIQYQLSEHQRLIELAVYDRWDPLTRRTPDNSEVAEALELQIWPYLASK